MAEAIYEYAGLLYCREDYLEVVEPDVGEAGVTVYDPEQAEKEWPVGAWCDVCQRILVERHEN